MSKKISHLYRVPLLLSITLGIVIVALKVEREVLTITLIFIGSILGTFVLDLDYLIHSYFVAPEEKNSLLMADYLKHKDWGGFFRYIQTHRYDIEDQTLNSALFQIVLGAATIFTLSTEVNVLIKALMISAFLNSIYRFVEYYLTGHLDKWFWSLKVRLVNNRIYLYTAILLITFLYCLHLF